MLLLKMMLKTIAVLMMMMMMKEQSLKARNRREPSPQKGARASTTGKGLIRIQHCLAVDVNSPVGPPVTSSALYFLWTMWSHQASVSPSVTGEIIT